MKSNVVNKIYLRFHARIILAIVAFSGFISSHLLLKYAELEIKLRYPLSAFISYGVFVVAMHFWKEFLVDLHPVRSETELKTVQNESDKIPFHWRDYLDALDVSSDLEDFFVSIVMIILVVILFYSVGLILFEIPIMLIELVLSGLGSSLLLKSIRSADNDIFVFKVIKQTLLPGLLIVVLYFLIGLVVAGLCPTAVRFSDIFLGSCSLGK